MAVGWAQQSSWPCLILSRRPGACHDATVDASSTDDHGATDDGSGVEVIDEDLFVDRNGTFSFFDAIFAVAMTLLVTTISVPDDAWSTWSGLWNASSNQLQAFVLSFVIVGSYWWQDRRFLTRLRGLTPQIVFVNMVLLAFVVLLPFTTNALADSSGHGGVVVTVVYSIHIAAISLSMFALYLVARSQRLLAPMPSRQGHLRQMVDGLLVPAVFLGSIPITVLVDPGIGRWSWISLLVLAPAVGRWADAAE